MFDLIGYWFTVSVLVGIVVFPIVCLLQSISEHMLGEILDNRWKGQDVVRDVFNASVSSGLYIRGKYIAPDDFVILTNVLGAAAYILVVVYALAEQKLPTAFILDWVHYLGSMFAPAGVYLVLPILIYFGVIYAGRKFIAVKAKLDVISDKLKEVS